MSERWTGRQRLPLLRDWLSKAGTSVVKQETLDRFIANERKLSRYEDFIRFARNVRSDCLCEFIRLRCPLV